jgi:UDP-N-acetylmuramyl pentapeptide phosphotransferase/UDP-N-acetylglucosamine-1-phosphate transferase
MTGLVAAVLGGGVCFVVLWWLLRSGRAAIALDRPNERSLHSQPIPRVGGLGIMAGALPALVVSGVSWVLPAAALMLSVVSFADDRKGLPIGMRFGAHFAAAAALLALGLPAGHLGWWLPIVAVAVVWMTNLYNFMDGSDGLAGGMALFGFGACAVAAQSVGDTSLAAGAAGIAAAAGAFLVFNFHPARVFMGDAGSIPLGFLAAALGLVGWARGHWPLWFPVVVFGPFAADATVTLLRRMLRGERFWRPHRTHYYQRLVQLGWGHRRTALAAYGLMVLSAAAALVAKGQGMGLQILLLAALAVVYVAAGLAVDTAWGRFARSQAANGASH